VSPLVVHRIENGDFAENCYLLHDPAAGGLVIVDPGQEVEAFLAEAGRIGRPIEAIWLTHAHIDHIQGVEEIHRATGAPIHLHPLDRPLYDSLPAQGVWAGRRLLPPPPPDRTLAHGQSLSVGGIALQVRHVPGHTPGHVVFVAPGQVIGGDVLFQGSIGRTDLPGGDHRTLLASIRRELFSLPDETVVHPGHGDPTTIGVERKSNPFLTSP